MRASTSSWRFRSSSSLFLRHSSCSASDSMGPPITLPPPLEKISAAASLAVSFGGPHVPACTVYEGLVFSITFPKASLTTPSFFLRMAMYSSHDPGAPISEVGIFSGSTITLPERGSRSPSLSLPDVSRPLLAPIPLCSASLLACSSRSSTRDLITSDLLICPRSAPAPLYSSSSLFLSQSQSTIRREVKLGRRVGLQAWLASLVGEEEERERGEVRKPDARAADERSSRRLCMVTASP
mmetsp:Transcript_14488/g.33295  ORF Transcript_14488/g.33295 Transcript_14488/m.33295 type:complete len:239 (-) Transcript_14488:12-728(-)